MISLGRNIMVVGCAGSGKSTLARQLGAKLGLRVVHIDPMYWKSGWVQRDAAETRKLIEDAIVEDGWVFDGNNSSTHHLRAAKADTVIWLDLPRHVCLWSVIKRLIVNYGRTREDLSEGCPERFDWPFLVWVWNFERDGKPKIEKLFRDTDGKLQQVRLRSRREVRAFVDRVQPVTGDGALNAAGNGDAS